MEKREILSHQKIFRQINSLVTYLVKPLISRNFRQNRVTENSRNFHTVQKGLILASISRKKYPKFAKKIVGEIL